MDYLCDNWTLLSTVLDHVLASADDDPWNLQNLYGRHLRTTYDHYVIQTFVYHKSGQGREVCSELLRPKLLPGVLDL